MVLFYFISNFVVLKIFEFFFQFYTLKKKKKFKKHSAKIRQKENLGDGIVSMM
jgi:hypothetical protein